MAHVAVHREPPPPPPRQKVASVVLSLSAEEAVALRTLLGYIGGAQGPFYKHREEVYEALCNAGVPGTPDLPASERPVMLSPYARGVALSDLFSQATFDLIVSKFHKGG